MSGDRREQGSCIARTSCVMDAGSAYPSHLWLGFRGRRNGTFAFVLARAQAVRTRDCTNLGRDCTSLGRSHQTWAGWSLSGRFAGRFEPGRRDPKENGCYCSQDYVCWGGCTNLGAGSTNLGGAACSGRTNRTVVQLTHMMMGSTNLGGTARSGSTNLGGQRAGRKQRIM